jgi:hypothetical protein
MTSHRRRAGAGTVWPSDDPEGVRVKRWVVGALLAGAVALTGTAAGPATSSGGPAAGEEQGVPSAEATGFCGENPSPPATCAADELTFVPNAQE